VSSRVLYYPWLDVHHIGWLKTALLYWDEVSTLVPEGVTVGRQHRETQAAAEAEALTPLPVRPNGTVVQQADAALRNRPGMQWIRALWRAERAPSNDLFSANWPLDLTMTIEQGKLPFTSVTHGTDHDQPWVRLPTASAALYLSALAAAAAEEHRLPLYTGEAGLAPWAESVHWSTDLRDDVLVPARYEDPAAEKIRLPGPGGLEYQAHEYRLMNRGASLLVHTTLEGISVSPDTDITKILKFREKHRTEMTAFRAEVENLGRQLGEDYPTLEAMQEAARQAVKTRLDPLRKDLGKARLSAGIQAGQDIVTATCLSPAPALAAALAGFPPLALGLAIAVPGVAIALTVAKLYIQRGRGGSSPFSYVVSLEKRFGRSDSGVPLKWAADVDLTAG
jgi:hypothetical protein